MPAQDLAEWDISIINQTVLKPASYREMETEVVLKNGLGTRYGLGVSVRQESGRRAIEHGGEVSGFTADNMVFPDEGVAVVVLTNQDSVEASRHRPQNRAVAVQARRCQQRRTNPASVFEGCNRGRSTVRCSRTTRTVLHRTSAEDLRQQPRPARRTAGVLPNRTPGTRRHDFRMFEAHFPQKTWKSGNA